MARISAIWKRWVEAALAVRNKVSDGMDKAPGGGKNTLAAPSGG